MVEEGIELGSAYIGILTDYISSCHGAGLARVIDQLDDES